MSMKRLGNGTFEALGLKFHEKIWTLRCEAVAKWEELSGIKEMKRKRTNKNEEEEGINESEKATRSQKRQKKEGKKRMKML
ncbi:24890_t:CDS:2 [Gigaspora rosea]|nr:24890_t:CDS:2 [Gigaspora rosea]